MTASVISAHRTDANLLEAHTSVLFPSDVLIMIDTMTGGLSDE